MKSKVLIVISDIRESFSEGYYYFSEIISYFNKINWEIHIVATRSSKHKKPLGAKVYKAINFPLADNSNNMFLESKYEKLKKKLGPQLTIAIDRFFAADVHIVSKLLKEQEVVDYEKLPAIFNSIKIKPSLIVPSEFAKINFLKSVKVPEHAINVIPPMIPYNESFDSILSEKINSIINPNNKKFVIGTTLAPSDTTSLEKLLRSMELLPKDLIEQCQIVLLAETSLAEKGFWLINSCEYKDAISFIKVKKEVGEYYCIMDIILDCTGEDAFGMGILKSMQLGKIIVGAATVGAMELLEDESKKCVLVEFTVNHLALLLKKLITDESYYNGIKNQNLITYTKLAKTDRETIFARVFHNKNL